MLWFFSPRKNNEDKVIIDYIQNVFGFKPGKLDIYKVAFTHRSSSMRDRVRGTLNNERLEYLGDAVLSAVVADFLFRKFPLLDEGPLTEIRSKIVCRDRLNMLSKKIGLDYLVRINENVHAKSANGDAFEALVGAMYLDQGYLKTKKILLKKIFLVHLDINSIITEESNYKSKILSWAQKHHKTVKFANNECYDSFRKLFKAQLFIDGELFGEGMDYTIKKAEQTASAKSWEKVLGEIKEEL